VVVLLLVIDSQGKFSHYEHEYEIA